MVATSGVDFGGPVQEARGMVSRKLDVGAAVGLTVPGRREIDVLLAAAVQEAEKAIMFPSFEARSNDSYKSTTVDRAEDVELSDEVKVDYIHGDSQASGSIGPAPREEAG